MKTRTMGWSVMSILAAAFLLIGAASPAPAPGTRPCAADAQRLCPGVRPGQGRLRACLEQHKEEVSEACRAHLLDVAESFKGCEGDVKAFCAGTQAGQGRLRRCLRGHESELSPACKAALSAR